MFQVHTQALRPLTTAHLAQTMTLLSLTVDELRQEIDSELASNPALELVEERRCPTCRRLLPEHGVCPVCSCPSSGESDEPVVFVSQRDDFYYSKSDPDSQGEEDDFSTTAEDLPTYVMRQVAPELDSEDRHLAAFLLTHLDDDGLLTTTVLEVARYHHVLPSKVEHVLNVIKRAEPVGVGSRTTQEALLAQLDVIAETSAVPELARLLIEKEMDRLKKLQYAELARRFDTSQRKIQEVVHFISENLNPYPARSHWGSVREPTQTGVNVYQHPDILINYINGDPKKPFVVEIIMPIGGILRVSPMFRNALREAGEEKREAWKSDLERASLLVKCLQQRNNTMQRLMQQVVTIQKDAILHGERHLRSVTRVEISKILDVHESTISRAVAGKTVQLPNKRIVPLSMFFDRSLSIRTVLCDLIAKENKPLSDAELAKMLEKEGYKVARRTVAKYRAMEGVLPAHLRHTSIKV